MKIRCLSKLSFFAFFAFLILFSCKDDSDPFVPNYQHIIVSANQNSSSLTYLDGNTNEKILDYYVRNASLRYPLYVSATDKIYVTDAVESRLFIFDGATKNVDTVISVSRGPKQLSADIKGEKLWISCVDDSLIEVINLQTLDVERRIPLYTQPHDIFVKEDGSTAYVSINARNSDRDSVYIFDGNTYQKTHSQPVYKKPQVYYLSSKNQLYVPNESGVIMILDGTSLRPITEIEFPYARGITATPDQKNVFVTSADGSQIMSIFTENYEEHLVMDTMEMFPFDIITSPDGAYAYVTHNESSISAISIYIVNEGQLHPHEIIRTPESPAGIAYVKRSQFQ